jgi:hypothetical protein
MPTRGRSGTGRRSLPAGSASQRLRGLDVVAATIIRHTGDIARFATADRFATYTGRAPIEWSSGKPKETHPTGSRDAGTAPSTTQSTSPSPNSGTVTVPAAAWPQAHRRPHPLRSTPRPQAPAQERHLRHLVVTPPATSTPRAVGGLTGKRGKQIDDVAVGVENGGVALTPRRVVGVQ